MTITKIVRPNDAASLVLLRETPSGLEVLLGRRGSTARFMPGRYVFPGGRIAAGDARAWWGEDDRPADKMRALKHAALRETFEETGLVVGLPVDGTVAAANGLSPVEAAYRDNNVRPVLDQLRLVGRAITPTVSPIRFHARFFVCDARLAAGAMVSSEEFDDLRWQPVNEDPPGIMQQVTRHMLDFAIEVWNGRAPPHPPLLQHRRDDRVIRRDRPAR